jgi:hypothetical protein
MKRPWICPEPCCCPIFQAKDSDYEDISVANSGQSFLCFGKLSKPIEFTYNGVNHKNDLGTCMYSALKGIIRYQENKADWEWLGKSYGRALEKLREIESAKQ